MPIKKVIEFLRPCDSKTIETTMAYMESSPESIGIIEVNHFASNIQTGMLCVIVRSNKSLKLFLDYAGGIPHSIVRDPSEVEKLLQNNRIRLAKVLEAWAVGYSKVRLKDQTESSLVWPLFSMHMKCVGANFDLILEVASDALPLSNIQLDDCIVFGENGVPDIKEFVESGMAKTADNLSNDEKRYLKYLKYPKDYKWAIDNYKNVK